MVQLSYSKIRDVESPRYANDGDAGLDFYVPKYSYELMREIQALSNHPQSDMLDIIIPANSDIKIPSGIKVNIPKHHYLQVGNKSGIATKKYLTKTAEIVDSTFQGEIIFCLYNRSESAVHIPYGTKIMQLILLELPQVELKECHIDDLYDSKSSRGEGGFGSTGIH